MSRLAKAASATREHEALRTDEIVTNFMGGDSYKLTPLTTLRMIAASSIFGEPSYYRNGGLDGKEPKFCETEYLECIRTMLDEDPLSVTLHKSAKGKSTTEVFTEAIDAALDADFEGTLKLAVELRKDYNMRLNPQVIMVRASMHPKRAKWTEKNPGKFSSYEELVMSRADEPMTQLAYFIAVNNGKKKMPTILKKACAKKLSELNAYNVNKYKNAEIGMINAVRLTHANSPVIDELMRNGSVKVEETDKTWEQLKSEGKSWKEILKTIKLGHMALLRNLRGIFSEIDDPELCAELLKQLKDGVLKGKQFPFRYWSAYKAIENCSDVKHKPMILDALDECIDISVNNMPHLKGRTMCLSDNSGSAWGSITSEYGTVTVAEIDNLSSVVTAMASDEGYVGKFGDTIKTVPIRKRVGAMTQTKELTSNRYSDVGGSTEGGIWEFFRDAIKNKDKYDNIVIYSDMQAGTGGLYGTSEHMSEYRRLGFGCERRLSSTDGRMINVYKLVREYRKKVNSTVNVMLIQTAGYSDTLLPEMSYRTAICSGWTGKEATFLSAMTKEWDNVDNGLKQ